MMIPTTIRRVQNRITPKAALGAIVARLLPVPRNLHSRYGRWYVSMHRDAARYYREVARYLDPDLPNFQESSESAREAGRKGGGG
jgi:hypothetical protein